MHEFGSLIPFELADKIGTEIEAACVTIDSYVFRRTLGWPGSVQEMTLMKGPSNVVRVVVVDDDHLFCETLGLCLIDEGYEVASFSSGDAALEHFVAGHSADVVLLDWHM